MSANSGGSPRQLAEEDGKVLVGILAYVQAALLVDESAEIMPKLLDRLRKDLRSFGLTTSDEEADVREAVAGLNHRVRKVIGEM